jgi:hypothetical protein
MDDREVWAALERGGAVEWGHFAYGDSHSDLRLRKYNGLLDPPGAEMLAQALAARLAGRDASLVVVWEDVEDVVLGYVVGRHLSAPVLRTFNADGLVGHTGPLAEGAKAVMVTDSVRDRLAPRAVQALLERSGGSLVGAAALVDAAVPETALIASLVSMRARLVRPADCPACGRGEPLTGSQESGVGSRGTANE